MGLKLVDLTILTCIPTCFVWPLEVNKIKLLLFFFNLRNSATLKDQGFELFTSACLTSLLNTIKDGTNEIIRLSSK